MSQAPRVQLAEALRAGADGVLGKPFSNEDLLDAVRTQLEGAISTP